MTETTFEVGQRLRADLDTLMRVPIGTLARLDDYTDYVREADGWHAVGDQHGFMGPAYTGNIVITSIGERTVTETCEQFKQRFTTTVIGKTVENGVDLPTVLRALSSLDCEPEAALRVGMWVYTRDDDLWRRLPENTVLTIGDATDGRYLGVYAKRGEFVATLLGSIPVRRNNPRLMRVISFPEGTDVEDWSEPTADDEAQTLAFKRRAWEVSVSVKSSTQWCGQLEEAMYRSGIWEAVMSEPVTDEPGDPALPYAVGDNVNGSNDDHVREMPEGTIIAYRRGEDGFNFTVRGDGEWARAMSSNHWNTVHLFGPNGGQYGGQGEVVHIGGQPMCIEVKSRREIDSAPIGTIMRQRHNEGSFWRKEPRTEWVNQDGNRWTSSDFTVNNGLLNFEHIPHPHLILGVDNFPN